MEVLVDKAFDEQLQFTGPNGSLLSNMKYTLTLENGAFVEGITDERGRTARIRTSKPVAITKAKLQPTKAINSCCSRTEAIPDALLVEIMGVTTNSLMVGISKEVIKTSPGQTRSLTPGEIAMARMLFKDGIDYSKVKLHNYEFVWLLQPNDTAMTPQGEIYFHPKEFREDFSAESIYARHWFMHEMVHVWQYQLGYPTLTKGANRLAVWYKYALFENHRGLEQYNMEAQGDLLADYWTFLEAKGAEPVFMKQMRYSRKRHLYEKTLYWFLKDPKSPSCLPGDTFDLMFPT
ncbi:MAG: hypothetical protein WKG03_16340 [Telluria sp.]